MNISDQNWLLSAYTLIPYSSLADARDAGWDKDESNHMQSVRCHELRTASYGLNIQNSTINLTQGTTISRPIKPDDPLDRSTRLTIQENETNPATHSLEG